MNFSSRSRRREMFAPDLTPMIDVVFQLVLFLLLSTTFKKEEESPEKSPGIQVDLPRSSAQAVVADKKDLNVWMASTGEIFLDEAPTSNDGLKRAFHDAAKSDTGTLVIIKADKGVSHGKVVTVMDLARNEGLTRLAIATSSDDQQL